MNGIVLRDARRGGQILAGDMTALGREVRSMRLFAGPGIRMVQTPGGVTISAAPRGRAVLRARVSDAAVGTVTTDWGAGALSVLAEGGTYITDVAELSLVGSLPSGSRVIVHPVLCRLLGGD